MPRLKFFILFISAMVFAWFGLSHVFSKWADQAQADAQALALQTARVVAAQLPTSPYASLVHSPMLRQVLVMPPSRVKQEITRRLPDIFPGWGAEDMVLLVEKTSEKAEVLRGQQWAEAEGETKERIQEAARRREAVEMGGGLKMFFSIEPPVGTESNLSLWIGGPVIRSAESSLGQELRRTPALGLGVSVAGKLVMHALQSPQALDSLSRVDSNIQPDSVGMLQGATKKGGLISLWWGTSKQLATEEVAVRQSLNIGKAELLLVLGSKAHEALLGAEQVAFYGWWAVLVLGLLTGFMLFPARLEPAPNEDTTETMEHVALSPSSLLAADGPRALRKITIPPEHLPAVPPRVSEPQTLKEAAPLAPQSTKMEAAEPAFALPSSPPAPPAPPAPSSFMPSVVVAGEEAIPLRAEERVSKAPSSSSLPFLGKEAFTALEKAPPPRTEEWVSKAPSSPPWSFLEERDSKAPEKAIPPRAEERVSKAPSSSSLPFLGQEEFTALGKAPPPRAEERVSKAPSSSPWSFLEERDSKAPEKAIPPRAEKRISKAPSSPFLAEEPLEPLGFLQPKKTKAPSVPSLELLEEKEASVGVGLHGKAVHPEELLGVDHAPHENPAAGFEATLREEAERFLGADFLPEHSSLAGEVLSTSATEGPEAAEWRSVFAEFLRVRKQCNQDTESLNFERFKAKLESSKSALLAKHNCKTVRFLVQIKDGKAAIKAIPVRP